MWAVERVGASAEVILCRCYSRLGDFWVKVSCSVLMAPMGAAKVCVGSVGMDGTPCKRGLNLCSCP